MIWPGVADHPWVGVAGWTMLLALWETTIAAAALALWRRLSVSATARTQYRVSGGLLLVSLALVGATPLVMLLEVQEGVVGAAPARGLVTSRGLLPLDGVVGWLGLAWAVGTIALLLRLGTACLAAARVRRLALPCRDAALRETVARQCRIQRVRPPVLLLESARVAVPVVVGWRQPAIVAPESLATIVPRPALEAILAHEVAHVRRRDYLVNLLQRVVESLLFFSPAVHWMSARAREAREYCCDDAALRFGGTDRASYARALTTLASLSLDGPAPVAPSAVGPPLSTRLFRILQEDPMPRFATGRSVVFVVFLCVLLVTGVPVARWGVSGGRQVLAAAAQAHAGQAQAGREDEPSEARSANVNGSETTVSGSRIRLRTETGDVQLGLSADGFDASGDAITLRNVVIEINGAQVTADSAVLRDGLIDFEGNVRLRLEWGQASMVEGSIELDQTPTAGPF